MSTEVMPPIVLTGPTGWIGQAMLARLANGGDPDWHRNLRLFGSRAGEMAVGGLSLPVRPLDALTGADVEGALVVHLAYLTKEKAELLGERRFTDTNLSIDDRLLAAIDSAAPRAVFAASSGAAALAEDGRDRHPYGLCKLRQEDRLLDWSSRTGVPALAGRIWNIAGPYMNKLRSYALGDMLAQARTTGRIGVGARVPVFRSYLHVADLCDLVLAALSQGIGLPAPVDLCGAEVLEMGDLADRVAAATGLAAGSIDRGPVDWTRPSVYLGSFAQTRSLAMAVNRPLAPIDRQIADTDAWIRTQDQLS